MNKCARWIGAITTVKANVVLILLATADGKPVVPHQRCTWASGVLAMVGPARQNDNTGDLALDIQSEIAKQ